MAKLKYEKQHPFYSIDKEEGLISQIISADSARWRSVVSLTFKQIKTKKLIDINLNYFKIYYTFTNYKNIELFFYFIDPFTLLKKLSELNSEVLLTLKQPNLPYTFEK